MWEALRSQVGRVAVMLPNKQATLAFRVLVQNMMLRKVLTLVPYVPPQRCTY